jgi:hypothetical protein
MIVILIIKTQTTPTPGLDRWGFVFNDDELCVDSDSCAPPSP